MRSNSAGLSNNLTTTGQTKNSDNHAQHGGLIQQRSLAKQFEQMDLGSKKGFVVNTLQTANQRASSSKSGGAVPNSQNMQSFAQKLASQQSSKGATGVQTPLAPATHENTMVKVNNLTNEVNDILMGSRSNSIGTANST